MAADFAWKQVIHAENLFGFLGFACLKPYVMYTDSTACLSIASNAMRLGNVRHLAIRYNLMRCYVTIGKITMRYCVTEEMIADLLTTIRFYNLRPSGSYYVLHHISYVTGQSWFRSDAFEHAFLHQKSMFDGEWRNFGILARSIRYGLHV